MKNDSILTLVKTIYQSCQNIKASNIVVLDVRKKTSFTDYLIIASATNTRQVHAIATHIEEQTIQKLKRRPLGVEGAEHAVWILLDYGDIVCHVFLEEARDFYRLEELWHDAKKVRIKKYGKKK